MSAFYNEIEPFAVEWLRNLDAAGRVASGVVDERSIVDLQPDDVSGFTQAHFFAGIGGWSHALRLAGWPDNQPVWTGSCPCQPFSSAGRRGGISDKRHLWPEWFRLIRECRPDTIFGEQVASPDGLKWLDIVSTDLEGAGYAVGAVDTCAASIGAPHIRQRLYFVAHRDERGFREHVVEAAEDGDAPRRIDTDGCEPACGMGDSSSSRGGRNAGAVFSTQTQGGRERIETRSVVDELVSSSPTGGFWADAEWIYCLDDKYRPIEPGTFPLVDGFPARVGKLRGYGNAIVPQVAATFIKAAIGAIQND